MVRSLFAAAGVTVLSTRYFQLAEEETESLFIDVAVRYTCTVSSSK